MRLAGVRMMVVFTTILIGITIAPAPARAAGGTISGTVYTSSWQPAAGAQVLVDGAVVTTTDAAGTFRTPALTAGVRVIEASLVGFGPSPFAEVMVSDDTDRSVLLVLGYPPGTIAGVTTDAEGALVAGATITVDGVASAVSAADGSYVTAEVSGGQHWVSASAPGYSQPDNRFVFVSGPVTRVSVSVGWRDGTVSGVVTDVRGNPVAGASVLIDEAEVATSAPDGSFTTGVVGGGWRSIVAVAEGYTSAGPSSVLVSGATTGVTAPAGYGSGTIAGIVRDGGGLLVAGAEIRVDGAAVATSAADGSFVTPVLAGGFRSLQVVADGYGEDFPTTVLVSGDITGIVLSPGFAGGVVSGVVVDDLDQPVPGASVSVDGAVVATSAADGTFVTESLPGGVVTVTASTPETFDGPSVFLTLDGDVSGVRVPIGRAAAVVTGVVRSPDGAPLGGIAYDARWWGTAGTTGDDGTYTIKLDVGQHRLRFTDPTDRYRPTVLDVELTTTGTNPLDVTMQPRVANVTGIATDADGVPVAGAVVRLNGLSTSPPTTLTDDAGRFAFIDVTPYASYWISIDPPIGSGLVRYTQPLAVVDPDEVIELDITMDAAARIEIGVTADGGPAQARAVLYDTSGPFDRRVTSGFTDDDGDIVLSELQPGRYVIEIENAMPGFASEYFPDSWYRAGAQVIDLAAGQVVSLDADLERSATITGVVIGPDGQPDPGAGVMVQAVGTRSDLGDEAGSGACNDFVDTDPPGTYRKTCLHPSAQYIVWVGEGLFSAAQYYDGATSPDGATPVTVTEGGTTSGIDFRLEAVAPPVELLGLSRQFFRAGTTTTGVRLYGDNFPLDPNVLVAEVQRAGFDDVVVDIDVTSVVSPRIAVVSVTVSDGQAAPGPRSLLLGRVGSFARDFCDTCLYLGSASTEVGAMSGRVTTATGAPIPLAQVIVTGPNLVPRRIIAGPDGRWLATGLSPGQHRVTFIGTARWAGEHWRDTSRVASARTVTITANRLRRGIDATLSRRPAVAVTSVSPSVVDNGFARLVLRGTGLAPIEGGFTVVIQRDDGFVRLLGPVTDRTGSSLAVEAWVGTGTYDVIIRWTGRGGTTREQQCNDCLTVRPPFFEL